MSQPARGGTNAITGVAAAWQDSTPCLFISGQVKRSDLGRRLGRPADGVQEIDSSSLVKAITKYARNRYGPRDDPLSPGEGPAPRPYGRPGPVWIDVPWTCKPLKWSWVPSRGSNPLQRPDCKGRTNRRMRRPRPSTGRTGPNAPWSWPATESACRGPAPISNNLSTCWACLSSPPGRGGPDPGEPRPHVSACPGPSRRGESNFTLQNSDWLLVLGARWTRR